MKLRDAGNLPTRRAFVVSAGVAVFAVVVYALVAFLAPHLAHKEPSAIGFGRRISGTADVPLATAGATPTEAVSPLVTPILTAATRTFSPSPTRSTPTPRLARGDAPQLVVSMWVDRTVAMTSDTLTYEVRVKNVGGRTYNGALTINVHTPIGTLRCAPVVAVEVCSTSGDYDGTSRDPNAPHANPPGTTKVVGIRSNASAVLLTLRVQVAPTATAGTILHNHAHVDGVGSVTTDASNVTTKSVQLSAMTNAPDVRVR